ncbi:hypothetical protein ES707_14552 [subsurface metagenome]
MSKHQIRRKSPSEHWVRLDSKILNEPPWQGLSPAAKIFYVHLKNEYYGYNNGEIKLPYCQLKKVKGCSGKHTISKAIKELSSKGWISIKQIGGLRRHYKLYKITWKYDVYIPKN